MHIPAGRKVLDVGCGSGFGTVNFASLVQATGHVIEVDLDQEMINQADRYAEAAGVKDQVFHWHPVKGKKR